MDGFELFAIALGLSMDAFAVAITKGLCLRKMRYQYALIVALFFGGFQALMPLAGYFLGVQFEDYLTSVDHWIIFGLLFLIGVNMIVESREKDEDQCDTLSMRNMTMLSLATSIDALAAGITFAFLHANIYASVAVIGITTLILSFFGVVIGNHFGARFKSKADVVGGIVLILIGAKILLEHLGFIAP